jgi:hypothetical protein
MSAEADSLIGREDRPVGTSTDEPGIHSRAATSPVQSRKTDKGHTRAVPDSEYFANAATPVGEEGEN